MIHSLPPPSPFEVITNDAYWDFEKTPFQGVRLPSATLRKPPSIKMIRNHVNRAESGEAQVFTLEVGEKIPPIDRNYGIVKLVIDSHIVEEISGALGYLYLPTYFSEGKTVKSEEEFDEIAAEIAETPLYLGPSVRLVKKHREGKIKTIETVERVVGYYSGVGEDYIGRNSNGWFWGFPARAIPERPFSGTLGAMLRMQDLEIYADKVGSVRTTFPGPNAKFDRLTGKKKVSAATLIR